MNFLQPEIEKESDIGKVVTVARSVAAFAQYEFSFCEPVGDHVVMSCRLRGGQGALNSPQDVCDIFRETLESLMLFSTKGPIFQIGSDSVDITMHIGYPKEMRSPTIEVAEKFLALLLERANEIAAEITDLQVLGNAESYHQIIDDHVRDIASKLLPSITAQIETMSTHSRIAQSILSLYPNYSLQDATLESVIQGFRNPIILGMYMHHIDTYLNMHGYSISHQSLYQDLAYLLEPELFGMLEFVGQKIGSSTTKSFVFFDTEGSFLSRGNHREITRLIESEKIEIATSRCPALSLDVWLSSVRFSHIIATEVKKKFPVELAALHQRIAASDPTLQSEDFLIAGFLTNQLDADSSPTILLPDDPTFLPFDSNRYLKKN